MVGLGVESLVFCGILCYDIEIKNKYAPKNSWLARLEAR